MKKFKKILMTLAVALTMSFSFLAMGVSQAEAGNVGITPLQIAVPAGVKVEVLKTPAALDSKDLLPGASATWELKVENATGSPQCLRAGIITLDYFKEGVAFNFRTTSTVDGVRLPEFLNSFEMLAANTSNVMMEWMVTINPDPGKVTPTLVPFINEGSRSAFDGSCF